MTFVCFLRSHSTMLLAAANSYQSADESSHGGSWPIPQDDYRESRGRTAEFSRIAIPSEKPVPKQDRIRPPRRLRAVRAVVDLDTGKRLERMSPPAHCRRRQKRRFRPPGRCQASEPAPAFKRRKTVKCEPGWVAEWSKAAVLKTAVRETVPGVRIPPHPLDVADRIATDRVARRWPLG